MNLLHLLIVEMESNKNTWSRNGKVWIKDTIVKNQKINLSDKIIKRAKEFEKIDIQDIDILHLAVGDIEKIDYICTTDDRFIKRALKIKNLKTNVISPIKFIEEYEKWV